MGHFCTSTRIRSITRATIQALGLDCPCTLSNISCTTAVHGCRRFYSPYTLFTFSMPSFTLTLRPLVVMMDTGNRVPMETSTGFTIINLCVTTFEWTVVHYLFTPLLLCTFCRNATMEYLGQLILTEYSGHLWSTMSTRVWATGYLRH